MSKNMAVLVLIACCVIIIINTITIAILIRNYRINSNVNKILKWAKDNESK